jgi:WD40 repeat protein
MVRADSSLRLVLSDAAPLAINTESHRLYTLEQSSVAVRDMQSGALIETVISGVTGVLATSDCTAVLTQHGDDTSWVVWSLPGGTRRASIQTGRWTRISVCDFGGHFLLTCDRTGALNVWDLDSCDLIGSFDSGVGRVHSNLAASSGAQYLAAGVDRRLFIWNVGSGELVQEFPEQPTTIRHVAITPDATLALSSADDDVIRIWDLKEGREVARLPHGGGSGSLIHVTEQRRAVISTPFVGVSVWDLDTQTLQKTCSESSRETLVVSRDGAMASTSSRGEPLRLWQLDGASDAKTGHDYSASRVAMDPGGRFAVSAAGEELKMWEVRTGHEIMSTGSPGALTAYRHLRVSHDGMRIVAQHYDGERVFEWYPFESDRARLLPVRGELVAMSGDGEVIALRVSPAEVDLIDRMSRTVLRLALESTQPVEHLHLAMSRHLDVLYQFYETGAVIASSMRSGRELARIQLTDRISPWSAVASRDAVWWVGGGSVYCWNAEAEPRTLGGTTPWPMAPIAVSEDGRSIVYGADRNTIEISTDTGMSGGVGLTLDGEIAALAVSDDGSTIVAGDHSGGVYFIDVK